MLTLCSWLAPPLNNVVYSVRILGLVSLLIGSLILGCSCLVGALNNGKCCKCCYILNNINTNKKKRANRNKSNADDSEVIENSAAVFNSTVTVKQGEQAETRIVENNIANNKTENSRLHSQYNNNSHVHLNYGSCKKSDSGHTTVNSCSKDTSNYCQYLHPGKKITDSPDTTVNMYTTEQLHDKHVIMSISFTEDAEQDFQEPKDIYFQDDEFCCDSEVVQFSGSGQCEHSSEMERRIKLFMDR